MPSGRRVLSCRASTEEHIARTAEAGYAMAALLVGLAVLSVVASMVLPAWRHAAQREREAELIFRGEQYARAVMLYQRQLPGAFPPDVETLVEGRFLRREYLDPMTEDGEFRLVLQSELGTAPDPSEGALAADAERTGGAGPEVAEDAEPADDPGGVEGGIAGVASRSTAPSIAQYNGAARYDEWLFVVGADTDSTPVPGSP